MPAWKSDLLVALALFALSVGFYVPTLDFPEDVALFPSKLAPCLAVLSALLFVSALRRRHAEGPGGPLDWKRFAPIVLLVVIMSAYAAALPWLGYLASSILMTLGIIFGVGYKNKPVGLAVGAGAAALVYCLFKVILEVPLPVGQLFEMMME
ncbi:MAG: tripartite tricarboxylate transporter TctB family protein [Duodenibacillus sp.]|nr:tripartite tricarboxylate transporter TctB family protein [Duodenibacillus sp.]